RPRSATCASRRACRRPRRSNPPRSDTHDLNYPVPPRPDPRRNGPMSLIRNGADTRARPARRTHPQERRDSFMPEFLLAPALALLLILPARAAKPPELPLPTEFECVPFVAVPGAVDVPGAGEEQGPAMADRCEAMRTLSRCVLFGFHPLAAAVSTR